MTIKTKPTSKVPRSSLGQPKAAGPSLHFRISSALKRVIGRDLITDEFVAIFELVKNAFDARAIRVEIFFVADRLYIVDNGKGMSLRDIKEKWLFVAYSAKRDGTEEGADYRNRIGNHRAYAGSKGVGRFSCDRLGRTLRMQTRTRGTSTDVDVVYIDWKSFERDAKKEFTSVPVKHESRGGFDLPEGLPRMKSGTILEISGLHEAWDRPKFLRLRAALAKLINPFGEAAELFKINLRVPQEEVADAELTGNPDLPKDARLVEVVNGPVRNFIFDTLKGKTTHLEVSISEDGKCLSSTLTDRGTLIYSIREPNPYPLLHGSGFNCNLFYLNRSAKKTFASRMGITSVEFGSVFLFKNSFRIFPIGESGDDTFGIDRRKQQGYNRFLGTRDVIGRIDISGEDGDFRESTSRDQGLIDTLAYRQLEDCFEGKCFRRLERYVVGVNWKDALDLDVADAARLRGDGASARITAIITQLVDTKGVELVDYNRQLVRILNERSEEFSDSLDGLRILAEKSGDAKLLQKIEAATARHQELKRAEAAAREAADRERVARREAERKATDADRRATVAEKGYEEERKRNLFLTSISSLDKDTIEILHHQIIIHASGINEIIQGQFEALRQDKKAPTRESLLTTLENIAFQNKKVLSIARFATKANFRLDSEMIQEDLVDYFTEYVEKAASIFAETGIRILIETSAKKFIRKFKPIEVSILIDNLVSNAGKAQASEIKFSIEQPSAKELRIVVQDDGAGFHDEIPDLERLFEKGYTTSTGSGLGLYHVVQILQELGGSIIAERTKGGAKFIIRIKG